MRARELSAEPLPTAPAVARTPQILVAEIERAVGPEDERQRPLAAPQAGYAGRRRDGARLIAVQILAIDRAPEHDVGIVRCGRDIAALAAGGDRAPVALLDLGMIAAREDHRRAAILLRAVEAVRKRSVGRNVIELARRLVEPRAPRLGAVDAHARALIAGQHHVRRVRRIDPELVRVVAVGRSLDRGEVRAAVARAIERGIGYVHDVGILRIDFDVTEIPAALPQPAVAVDQAPGRTAVVAAVEPALLCVQDRVDAPRVARRDRQADLAQALARKSAAAHLLPGRAAIRRAIEPAARTVRGRIDAPRRPARLPQRGENDVPLRVGGEIDGARVRVVEQRARPGRAAVRRAKDAARFVGPVSVPERGHEQRLRVGRIDENASDLTRVFQTDRVPGFAGVVGAIHAVAVDDVRTHVGFAAAGVHGIRIAPGHRERTDGTDRQRVGDVIPGHAGIGRLPNAAADRTEVKRAPVAGHAGRGDGASAAIRPDVAPVQIREQRARHARRVARGTPRSESAKQRESETA